MADHGGTLRVVVPAASPSRRDYQLRSCRDEESSRPQSPWLPRGDESTTMSPFRLYESAVIDRPNSRSGPVPSPSYRRQLVQSGSFAGRLPSEEWNDRRVSSSPTSWRRNCVSGELGRSFELAKARGSKSGEIVGLEIRADGIFPIPESSSRARDPSVRKHSSPKLEGVRQHSSPSGSILWEALNDADNVVSPRRERVVPVPFKWEQTSSSSPSYSRISSDRCSSAKISKAELDVGSSAVPFKWEVRPGKPKELEVSEKTIPPALQLPPRLSSMKQRASSAPRYRSLSASLSSKLEEPPSPSSTSSPRRPSRHLSQFGTPQYQSADSYNFCCDSDRARSPTSTLCGPGTPSSSSSTSSSYSRKPSSISFSQNSGTSLESFDRWDHVSPTSRHSYAESQDSNSRDDRDANVADGAIVKLRRKLKSSKPPRSPMRAPSGEEFFDCQQALASSPRIPKREDEPATRLPYKMPPSPARDFEPLPESPTRGEFAHCLALPRFLSKSETAAVQWLQNPSWDSTAAPSRDLEDGYRSPAYKATLELLSPSPDLMSQKSRSSSSRRRHSHLVEVLCNSLKQSLQRCTKRSVARTHSIVLYDDQFTKRHQSFMW